ncbi:hypothetical protein HID58_068131 [Brassica napus]|uniref:Helicase C-terminal domain-containing protein n=1 Tax=Brassica napus TaxID=3708 RepID=A0ABQ7ZKJ2_BRANA|nr:hypothetical protein HID58_068131 [Brassica napus]
MAARRGGRELPMEDVCYYKWPLPGADKFGLFCVCDGHGGAGAANRSLDDHQYELQFSWFAKTVKNIYSHNVPILHYIKLSEMEKNCKLNDLLDALDFNQVVIFVKSVNRAGELNKLLIECNFPSICFHSGMSHEKRLTHYKSFKEGHKRILVATDLVGRGIDIERVNIVINYDIPDSADTYLHRVGRAGRFGTKGLAITFVASGSDSEFMCMSQNFFFLRTSLRFYHWRKKNLIRLTWVLNFSNHKINY